MTWGLIKVVAATLFLVVCCAVKVSAASSSIVISKVQVDGSGTGSTSQEYIEFYNNSSQDIDLTGWKVKVINSTGGVAKTIELGDTVRSHGYFLIASSAYIEINPNTVSDFSTLAGSMSAKGAGVQLFAASGGLVDALAWGSAPGYEYAKAPNPVAGSALVRTLMSNQMADSDNNSVDFTVATAVPRGGDVYEVVVDVCVNLDDVQEGVPAGYTVVDGVCHEVIGLQITELLPNPGKVADGEGEFIEIYNPTNLIAYTAQYTLQVGSSYQSSYQLPAGQIAPHAYLVVYSAQSHVSLSNSTSKARLLAPDNGEVLSETASYTDIDVDQSWAVIDGAWKVTDKPTPGAANEYYRLTEGNTSANDGDGLAPCPAGKYRSSETNRCRNNEVAAASLAACAANQTRNLETNRCRAVTTAASLNACQPGYTRNLETNRCRKSTTADSALAPCKAGQERNPETNRCRKILESPVATVDSDGDESGPTPTQMPSGYIMGGIAIVAGLGYAVYEWRYELLQLVRRFVPLRVTP